VIEASVAGRLLGLRILRLEASVVVAPASIDSRDPVRTPLPTVVDSSPEGALPSGANLADATRVLDESAATLASTRRPRRH
jgi:hypothetical protein